MDSEAQCGPGIQGPQFSVVISGHELTNYWDFYPRLQAHILGRLRGDTYIGDEPGLSTEELNNIIFQHDRIYEHATSAFNYTTYNIRRDQDTIHSGRDRCNIMLASHEDLSDDGTPPHPYWYARVLGIFHAKVFYKGKPAPVRIEFLWVRWFGRDPEWASGPKHRRLDRLGYVPQEDPEAFGFLDPSQVL